MTTQGPDGKTHGLGELVRAYRSYTGLSQRGFAVQLGMSERGLYDIESGRRGSPVGFIDSCESVVEKFDIDVKEAVEMAEQLVDSRDSAEGPVVHIPVSDDPDEDYQRVVLGRAAVVGGQIVPTLDGRYGADFRERKASTG